MASSLCLLGGHVAWGSEDRTFTGQARIKIGAAGQTEIDKVGHAETVDQHVPRFDVAMVDADAMGVVECIGKVAGNPDRRNDVQILLIEPTRKRATAYIFKRYPAPAVVVSCVVNRHDDWMPQPCRGACLAEEPLHHAITRLELPQHLEGHVTVETRVIRLIHLAETAITEQVA